MTQKIRLKLLARGLDGISRTELYQQTRTKVFKAEDLDVILEQWILRGWVERFIVPGNGKIPQTLYRATQDLRDQWANAPQIIGPDQREAMSLDASQL